MNVEFSKIYEGWKNNLFPSKEMKNIIKAVSGYRLDICASCPSHSKHHSSIRPDDHCVVCGCTLAAKTKCFSCECPLNKWLAVTTEEQEQEIINYEKQQRKVK
jgi:hypothetical protein